MPRVKRKKGWEKRLAAIPDQAMVVAIQQLFKNVMNECAADAESTLEGFHESELPDLAEDRLDMLGSRYGDDPKAREFYGTLTREQQEAVMDSVRYDGR